MRKTILLVVLLALTMVAAPAFAAVQNVQVEGGLTSTFVHRQNFDLGPSRTNDEQNVGITQATLQVNADLTDQVRAVIALINERAWDADPNNTVSDIDIYKAYVELREALYSNLTLIVGRQTGDEWSYGNSFIFNASGTNNQANPASNISSIARDLTKQSGLDAVRAILDFNPLTVEAFMAVVHPGTTTLSNEDDNKILYGIYNTYEFGDDMNTVADLYFFELVDKTKDGANPVENLSDKIHLFGVRSSTNPFEGLNVQGELAHQSGVEITDGANDEQARDAWGAQGIVNYQLPVMKDYKPVLTYVFTKVYGDKTSNGNVDNEYTGWDPFFESQASGTIYNTLYNLTNAVIHSLSLSANPMEDLTTKLTVTKLWMHQKLPAGGSSITLQQPDDSSGQGITTNPGKRELGWELDFETLYDYTEDVQFGLNVGFYKPNSDTFSGSQNDYAKQVLASVNVAF